MSNPHNDPVQQVKITCGSLLNELQIIWNEVGESEDARDKILLEIEQECLEVYRRKVDEANRNRAQLRQAIADCETELAAICSAMGERPVHTRKADQNAGSLKEELHRILPHVEEMRKRKIDRGTQFVEVHNEIVMISKEIYGSAVQVSFDETDLSLRKLEEFYKKLQMLRKEKSDRLKLVQDRLDTLYSLCSVLDMDFKHIASEVHPSYAQSEEGPVEITDEKIQHLDATLQKLREVKLQRMEKLQDLAATMLELWHLMDTPVEEQQQFQHVTCNIAASEHEITDANSLSMEFIHYVEAEVARLEELKSSKMKELVLKKKSELEEICRKTHIVPEANTSIEYAIEAIDSGNIDPATVLQQVELQIIRIKEESYSRKEVLEKVEKWLTACEEECWLEEYNRDENRYNAGRGAHLSLKRAEKARSLVNKLPGMVEALATKTIAWEKERGIEFLYDGIRLLSMLEEYTNLRQEKEEERKRQRDLKKLQGQLITEQEALYGSKPSPSKLQSAKKVPRVSTGGASNRKLSLGGAMIQTPKPDFSHSRKATTPHTRPNKKVDKVLQYDHSNFRQVDGFDALPAGKKGLDITGHHVKKQSSGATNSHHPESPILRRPFSPISSTASSNANLPEKTTATAHGEVSKKLIPTNDQPFATPMKTNGIAENRTPNVPFTVSAPMQTAMTPFPLATPRGVKASEEVPEEIEYSFEERRAGFVLPKAPVRAIQV